MHYAEPQNLSAHLIFLIMETRLSHLAILSLIRYLASASASYNGLMAFVSSATHMRTVVGMCLYCARKLLVKSHSSQLRSHEIIKPAIAIS